MGGRGRSWHRAFKPLQSGNQVVGNPILLLAPFAAVHLVLQVPHQRRGIGGSLGDAGLELIIDLVEPSVDRHHPRIVSCSRNRVSRGWPGMSSTSTFCRLPPLNRSPYAQGEIRRRYPEVDL